MLPVRILGNDQVLIAEHYCIGYCREILYYLPLPSPSCKILDESVEVCITEWSCMWQTYIKSATAPFDMLYT